MDIDDEDPAWLEACMAAVDSIPVANLTSTASGRGSNSRPFSFGVAPAAGGSPKAPASTQRTSHHPPQGASAAVTAPRDNNIVRSRGPGSTTGTGTATATAVTRPGDTWRGAHRVGHYPHNRHGSGVRRNGGVGVSSTPDHADEEIDPCWKCGEAAKLVGFGTTRYFGCTSYPLCNARRPTRRNGAVVELIAEETRLDGVGHVRAAGDGGAAAASSRVSVGGTGGAGAHAGIGASNGIDEPDPTGVTRCQLCVKVRGGHIGGAAQAAWETLRRNGIVPVSKQEHGGMGGWNRNGSNSSGGAAGGTEKLKAVLELGKRDAVKRLLKQANLAYRDIPQTTYSRLIASGAGEKTPTPTPAQAKRGGKGKAKRAPGSLLPLDVCETLLYTLPAGLRETLLPFQREGVLYGLRRKGRCLIADEMGTGKTLQALGVMGCYREDWPLLIVAPASMRLMWAEEVEHWYPFLDPSSIHLIKGNKDKLYLSNMSRHLWPRVVIVSYFMLRMLADSVGKEDWEAVIFDESHMISTRLGDVSKQAQQVKVCLDVAKRAKRVVMLSGTPSLSKPFQIFNQVAALSPGLLGTEKDLRDKAKEAFASNYCGGTRRGQTSKSGVVNRVACISGSDYPDELHLLLKNEVMIRRLKNNVVKQLPPLRRIVLRVMEQTQELRRVLKAGGFEADADADADDDDGDNGHGCGSKRGLGAGAMSDDQRAGLKKVKSASEWVVDKLISSQETLTKFVVFAHHKTVLDLLQEAFEVAGTRRTTPFAAAAAADEEGDDNGSSSCFFTCLRIDGSVPTPVRASRLAEFNNNKLCRVLVVSITAGGQGLDFTAASNVVFVELPESPAWLRQAEDRLHRRRQEKSVNVYLMVLPAGSHDDTRWLSLSQRLTTQTSVMNGTLAAENMDVDKVCDAGGIFDNDNDGDPPLLHGSRQGSLREDRDQDRDRERDRGDPLPAPQSSFDATGGDVTCGGYEDETGFDYGDNFDSDGGDDDDLDAMGGVDAAGDGDRVGADDDLDATLRMALMSTPSDVPSHRASQSPTLKLLRAIVQPPASDHDLDTTPAKPSIFSSSKAASSTSKKSNTTKGGQLSSNTKNRQDKGLEVRLELGQRQRRREKSVSSTTAFGSRWKSDPTKEARSHDPGERTAREGTFSSPFPSPSPAAGAGRKRPRPSSGSGCVDVHVDVDVDVHVDVGTSSPSLRSPPSSGNPFRAFGHRASRPSPPSPSSRLGGGPFILRGAVGTRLGRRGSGSASGSGSPPASRLSPASASSSSPLDCSYDSGDGSESGFASPTPKARRGTSTSVGRINRGGVRNRDRGSGAPGTMSMATATATEASSPGGDGSMSSPVFLVDLSQENVSDGKAKGSNKHRALAAGSSGEPGLELDLDLDLDLEHGIDHGHDESQPDPAEIKLGGASTEKENEKKNDRKDEASTAMLLPWQENATDQVFDEEGTEAESGADEGGPADRGGKTGEMEDEDEDEDEDGGGKRKEKLLADKLCFLVSGYTGRVHVYKKPEEGGLDDSFDFDDDEDRKPQHCRCNFRAEDMDRLFEAAKQALSLSSSPSPSSSSAAAAEACEAAAKEALSMLPSILRSAPALKVARAFVQEWRGLTSRKRDVLKKHPCRPPLADELHILMPALIGSTRRYAGSAKARPAKANSSTTSNTKAASGSSAGDGSADASCTTQDRNKSVSGKVMCLFCEEQPASEQGPPVHPRDRFCSVDCMEGHGSRNSNTSLRRLVLDRDHGVCSAKGCGRDCLALVSRLTAVKTHGRRRDMLLAADPRFGDEKHKNLLERLVRHPKGGNAWNADHVTAVYQGGGECGVENLRTLCVLCHAEVTRKQTSARAAARRLEKENRRRLREEAQGQRRLVSFGGGIALSAGSSQGSSAGRGLGAGSQADACEISSDESDTNGNNTIANDSDRHCTRRRTLSRSSSEAFERIVNGEDACLDATSSSPTDNGPALRETGGSCGGAEEGGGEGGASGCKDVDEDSDDCEIVFTRVCRPASTSSLSVQA
eukprot:g8960.t1